LSQHKQQHENDHFTGITQVNKHELTLAVNNRDRAAIFTACMLLQMDTNAFGLGKKR